MVLIPSSWEIILGPSEEVEDYPINFRWRAVKERALAKPSEKWSPHQTFSYKLDDGEWSEFSIDNELSLSAVLEDDRHIFLVRAQDEAGNIDESPAKSEFITGGGPVLTVVRDFMRSVEQEDLEGCLKHISMAYKDSDGDTRKSQADKFKENFALFNRVNIDLTRTRVTIENKKAKIEYEYKLSAVTKDKIKYGERRRHTLELREEEAGTWRIVSGLVSE